MNILAIDQGTSATKALVVGDGGAILAVAECPVHPSTPGGGAVEQDPAELLASVLASGRAAIAQAGVVVHGVGFANQGETVLAWDRANGRPLTTALSWQDRRAASVTDDLEPHRDRLAAISGLPLDPYFSAPKLAWLRRNRTTEGVVTTTDTWLVHALTGSFVTDVTTASRSMLLDLDRRCWSDEAAAIFGLDADDLPEVVGCATPVGTTSAFGPPLPMTGLAVDQQAALVGEGCITAGQAKCTFGTGAFLLVTTGAAAPRSAHGLSASVAWDVPGSVAYCLDGQCYTAGAAVTWLVSMGLLQAAADLDEVAASVPDTSGVTMVPALAGLGAPYWRPSAAGTLEGLDLHTAPAHVVRATLEGLAAQVAVLAAAVADDLGGPLVELRVDGGLTRSEFLMQHQADLLQVPVEVFASPHATALGVAALARLGLEGTGAAPEVPSQAPAARYEPRMGADEATERLVRFSAAADRAVSASDKV
ncbi:MAG TPA: FGGY family carbohydrate kinase [Acidimicrobiales bacterium]